jgi:phage terminase small subunit
MSLTEKQARFIEAYLIEPNGKRAALAAGYKEAGAAVEASRLLNNPNVAAELERRRKLLSIKTGITPERVLAELGKLGFSDIRQVVEWQTREVFDGPEPIAHSEASVAIKPSEQISDDAAAAISEVSQTKDGCLKVKMHDKLGALVKIGQHLGMFRTVQAEEPGKKEQAEQNAKGAQKGSDWDGLLPTTVQ